MSDTGFPAEASPGFRARLGRLRRLIRKELAEILRDRRTILTLVLMPLLLYPLLTIAFQQFLLSHRLGDSSPVYTVGYEDEASADFFRAYLAPGEKALFDDGVWRLEGPAGPGTITSPSALPLQPVLKRIIGPNLEQSLMKGEIDVLVVRRGSGRLVFRPDQNLATDWELIYREDHVPGQEAALHLRRLVGAANNKFLAARMRAVGIRGQRSNPMRVVLEARSEPGPKKPTTLAALVPLILILMTITGAVYPAIDLTAGERERGTLEILVAAPIPRLSLLFAKYVAVLTVAMLTAGVNLSAMTVTLQSTGMGSALLGGHGISPVVFLEIIGLLLLFAAFFSAVLLALTSFARSFKEAQAYLIPLMLVSLAPGMIGVFPGMQLEGPLAVAPLVNVVLLARDLIAGNASPLMAAVVVLTTFLYALAALALAARVFGAEAVLYSQTSSWSDLLRRPAQASDVPAPSAALLCLALMFPTYFLLNNGQSLLKDQPISVVLFVGMMGNVFLFLFPAVAAWHGHLRPGRTFALKIPPAAALCGALLLGLCCWPLTLQVGTFLRAIGISSILPEVLQQARDGVTRMRQVPVVFPLFALAVVTPLLEELFFRGYLFGALARNARPAVAIVSTAALFGIFHLILPGVMALERVVTTSLMGLVLGWVRWRSGSVWPGVVLHVLHNGSILMLGYYQPQLELAGWIQPGQENVPPLWLLPAGTGAALGAGLVWWTGMKSRATS